MGTKKTAKCMVNGRVRRLYRSKSGAVYYKSKGRKRYPKRIPGCVVFR